jgi:hypothetical protein
MAEAIIIVIVEAVEMNEAIEAIVTLGACWVIRAIGSAETSGILVVMSIPYKKWNIGETLLFFTFKQ